MEMEYRRLGRSGLKVSVLSFGSWVTFGPQLDDGLAADCLAAARDAGVNFFDNAESYSGGESERIMGKALARLGWPRHSYVRVDQVLLGHPRRGQHAQHPQPQVPVAGHRRLARALRPRLRRPRVLPPRRPRDPHRGDGVGHVRHGQLGQGAVLGHLGVDRRRDPGRLGHRRAPPPAQAGDGAAAVQHARAHARSRQEYARLYDDIGLGLTTWSPLASGLLTGKYIDGIPDGSRAALPGYEWLQGMLTDDRRNKKVKAFKEVADELGCTLAQLALAWCAKNPHVSTVITGASRAEQVHENMKALDVVSRLDDDVLQRIDEITYFVR